MLFHRYIVQRILFCSDRWIYLYISVWDSLTFGSKLTLIYCNWLTRFSVSLTVRCGRISINDLFTHLLVLCNYIWHYCVIWRRFYILSCHALPCLVTILYWQDIKDAYNFYWKSKLMLIKLSWVFISRCRDILRETSVSQSSRKWVSESGSQWGEGWFIEMMLPIKKKLGMCRTLRASACSAGCRSPATCPGSGATATCPRRSTGTLSRAGRSAQKKSILKESKIIIVIMYIDIQQRSLYKNAYRAGATILDIPPPLPLIGFFLESCPPSRISLYAPAWIKGQRIWNKQTEKIFFKPAWKDLQMC